MQISCKIVAKSMQKSCNSMSTDKFSIQYHSIISIGLITIQKVV